MIKIFLIALVVYAVSAGGAQSWGERSWQSNSGSNWGGWGGVGRGDGGSWGGNGGWGNNGGWGGQGGWGGNGGWDGKGGWGGQGGSGGNGGWGGQGGSGGNGGWGGEGGWKGEDSWAPAKYEYNYGVSDWKTGDNKEQSEERHGDVVRGQYSLLEADGTKRIVKYEADDKNGFNAKVIREGKAWHPSGWQGGERGGKW